jgi:tRNA splicing endonuclease
MLPIDFSPSSQAALDKASSLAWHFQAKLYLSNVIFSLSEYNPPGLYSKKSYAQDAKTEAAQHLVECQAVLLQERSARV